MKRNIILISISIGITMIITPMGISEWEDRLGVNIRITAANKFPGEKPMIVYKEPIIIPFIQPVSTNKGSSSLDIKIGSDETGSTTPAAISVSASNEENSPKREKIDNASTSMEVLIANMEQYNADAPVVPEAEVVPEGNKVSGDSVESNTASNIDLYDSSAVEKATTIITTGASVNLGN